MIKTLDAILYSDKNPLLADKHGEDYYAPVFRKLGITEEAFDSHYQINYDLPILSTKVKCLKRWIDNDITTTLNKLLSPDEQPSQNRVLFHRKKLYDTICNYLADIKNLIKKHNLDLDALLITKDYSQTPQLNECTYIFHYMILALIRCYMEFQQHFIEYIEKDKQLSVSDFFIQVLRWKEPDKVGISEIQHIEVPIVAEKPKQKKKETKTTSDVISFIYTCGNGKRLDCIKDFYDMLKTQGYISKEEPFTNIKHLLTGKEVAAKITWLKYKSELTFLIKYLVNTKAVLRPTEGSTHWDVIVHCFQDTEGNAYENLNLAAQHNPCPDLTKKLIDIAKALP